MKKTIAVVMTSVAILLSPAVLAQGGHAPHTSQYGGVVTEVNDMQYELVAKSDSIAIYVDDHGKKVDTKGASAKVTLLTGSEKTEAALVPAGENKLEAKGSFKVEKGAKVVAVVSMPGKPAQSVRFALK